MPFNIWTVGEKAQKPSKQLSGVASEEDPQFLVWRWILPPQHFLIPQAAGVGHPAQILHVACMIGASAARISGVFSVGQSSLLFPASARGGSGAWGLGARTLGLDFLALRLTAHLT